jgi:hypothetical protein
MSTQRDWGKRHGELATRLQELPSVIRLERGDNEEAHTLAHALLDIDGLCQKFHDDLMPLLSAPSRSHAEMEDTLMEMGEVFRELIYHLRDASYFRYLPGCEAGNT